MKFCSFLLLLISVIFIQYAQAKGIEPENAEITLSLTSEPPNLDSSLSSDTVSNLILSLTNRGLVVADRRGNIQPALATHWQINDLEVTFWLRQDALWSDGTTVTAHDFVYSFRRLVNPETGASGSAFFAYIIHNALDIMAGTRSVNDLGIEAIDDYTLKLTLSQPAPYFLNILTNSGYLPLRQKFIEAQKGKYAADAVNLLSNGPYILDSWMHSSSLVLKKNPSYWDADKIAIKQINFAYITSDTRSLLNLYKSNELAALRLNEDILKDTLEYGFRIQKAPTNCLSWIMLNMSPDKPTSNLKLRQAIRYAIDRNAYTNTIVGLPGTRTVDSVFTSRMKGLRGSFQKEFPAPVIEYNIKKARKLLIAAKEEMGLTTLPPLIMLINETRQVEAEFIQSQLINALGLDIRVDKQTFKQSLVKFRNGEFDLARSGFCGGTLQDPVFFAGIFESQSSFNDMNFSNSRYDELMALTHSTLDQQIRMSAFAEMQTILYQQVPIIPTIESAWVYIQNKRLKGLVRFPTVDFSQARISGAAL